MTQRRKIKLYSLIVNWISSMPTEKFLGIAPPHSRCVVNSCDKRGQQLATACRRGAARPGARVAKKSQSIRQASWIICKATTFSVNERRRVITFIDYLIFSPNIMTWGLQTSNLENFGYTMLQKNGPIFLPSVGPSRQTPKFLLNQGCFCLGRA